MKTTEINKEFEQINDIIKNIEIIIFIQKLLEKWEKGKEKLEILEYLRDLNKEKYIEIIKLFSENKEIQEIILDMNEAK